MTDVATFKARLLARQAELNGRLRDIEDDLDQPSAADSEERAVEREGDEVLEDLGNSGLVELRAIEAALKRIEDGEFGYCHDCGDDLDPARLDLDPTVPRCVSCTSG